MKKCDIQAALDENIKSKMAAILKYFLPYFPWILIFFQSNLILCFLGQGIILKKHTKIWWYDVGALFRRIKYIHVMTHIFIQNECKCYPSQQINCLWKGWLWANKHLIVLIVLSVNLVLLWRFVNFTWKMPRVICL